MGLLIDGTNEYCASTVNYVRPSTDHTVSIWLRLDGTGSVSRPFGNTGAWEMRTNTGTTLTSDLLQSGTLGTATLTVGVFHHFAVVQNVTGSQRLFYRDGVLVNTVNSASFSASQSGLLRIGSSYGGSNQSWMGAIDDFRVYDRILPLDEIQTLLYTRGHDGILDGIVSWYPMNEGPEGTTSTGLIDVIGGINCTTIVGTPEYNYDAGITFDGGVL